jgi:hypothetical protein
MERGRPARNASRRLAHRRFFPPAQGADERQDRSVMGKRLGKIAVALPGDDEHSSCKYPNRKRSK